MAAMTERTWSVYGFKKNQEGAEGRRGGVPEWRLPQAVSWAVFRGFDTILVELTNEPASSTRLKTHHLCDDPRCPGGCD